MAGRKVSLYSVAASVALLLSAGCSGVAFLDPQALCQGPFCDTPCDTDYDCPPTSFCQQGWCSTVGGGDPGAGGTGGGGGSGGPPPGDLIIILGDGRVTWGDAPPVGDTGPGDTMLMGDYATGGDLATPGDTYTGDTLLTGDVLVTGDSGIVCLDPDLDGYCDCCPLGPDCPAAGCSDGNPGCGEYNPDLNPGVPEVCDMMVDDNCNGEIDEGVQNGCGTCAGPEFCVEDTPWEEGGIGGGGGSLPGPDANPGADSCLPDCVVIDGVITEGEDANGFGAITLSEGAVATDFAWGANEIEGTVSRVDTVLGKEVGRYVTVMWRTDDHRRPYVQPWGPAGSRCAEPSRTTVDAEGNAYVANRNASGYSGDCTSEGVEPRPNGSVTKIAYYNATICDHTGNPQLIGCQCADTNGNGVIDTSFDHNQDQAIDLAAGALSGCVSLDPSQSPHEVPNGPTCSTSCTTDGECVTALGERHFCVNNACSDLPQRREFLDVDDECVMWTLRIPGDDTNANPDNTGSSSARGMAVDRDGHIWVGDDTSPWYFWKIFPEPPSASYPRGRGVFICPHLTGCCRDGDDCAGGDTPIPWNAECPLTARNEANRSVTYSDPAVDCASTTCVWTVDSSCRVPVTTPPYGAVIDSGESHPNGYGYLWTTRYNEGYLQRIDTETGAVSRRFRATAGSAWGSAYGITIDHEDRPWVVQSHTSVITTRPSVFRFNATRRNTDGTLVQNFVSGSRSDPDPTQAEQTPYWSLFSATAGTITDGRTDPWGTNNFHGRGITTELLAPATPGDPVTSRIWANFNFDASNSWAGNDNWIVTFDADTGVEDTLYRTNASPGPDGSDPCRNPIGIGMGFEDKVWVVNQNSWSMCAFDPWQSPSVSGGMVRVHHVPIGAKPYTYSDFTGSIFRSFTNPEGRYKILLRACPEDSNLVRWGPFRWEADVPGNSTLEVKFRFGDTAFEAMNVGAAQITGQVQSGPLPPLESFSWTPDPFETRIFCEVEFRFLADHEGLAPTLYSVDAARFCQPPG